MVVTCGLSPRAGSGLGWGWHAELGDVEAWEGWQLSRGGDPGSGRGQGTSVSFLGQLIPRDVVHGQSHCAPALAIPPPWMWDAWHVWVGWQKTPEL